MALNATNYQQLIIARLSNADAALLETLNSQIPLYWTLHNRYGYMPELQYWYTYRDGVRLAMACATREIDYIRRTGDSSRVSVEAGNQNSTMLAVSQDNSLTEANRSSLAQTDGFTESTQTGANSSARESLQESVGEMFLDDDSAGDNTTSRKSHQRTDTKEESDVENHTFQNLSDNTMNRVYSALGSDNNHQQDLQQDLVNQLVTPSDLGIADFPQFFPVGLRTITTNTGTTTVNAKNTDDTYATVPYPGTDTPIRKSVTETYMRVTPIRSVLMAAYDVPMKADGSPDITPSSIDPENVNSRKSTYSLFTAKVVSTDTNTSVAGSTATALAQSQGSADGATSGITQGASVSATNQIAIATRTMSGDGTSNRSNQLTSQVDSLMERLGQQFKHLQELWKNANEMIKWLESQRLVLTPYIVSQIIIQYPDGTDAATANQFLVQQP